MKAQVVTYSLVLFLLIACTTLLINATTATTHQNPQFSIILKRQHVINKLSKLLTQLKSAQIDQLSDFPTIEIKITCEQCMKNYKELANEAWENGESVIQMLRYWSASVEKCMKKYADTVTPKCIEMSKSRNPWEKK